MEKIRNIANNLLNHYKPIKDLLDNTAKISELQINLQTVLSIDYNSG